jgi:hypothetical protein
MWVGLVRRQKARRSESERNDAGRGLFVGRGGAVRMCREEQKH